VPYRGNACARKWDACARLEKRKAIVNSSVPNGPASTVNLSTQNVGTNNARSKVNFSVDNAVNLFQANGSDTAFPTLADLNGSGSFDWGLPFFYGRGVFTSIDGQPVPSGLPAAPWWAY